MPEHVPVSVAERISEEQDCPVVIVLAWDRDRTHIVTFGRSAEQSAFAADYGNGIKRHLGWSDDLHTESPKVIALKAQRAELIRALKEAEAGLIFAGADKAIPEGRFVPSPTAALRAVRDVLAKAST